MKLSACFRAFAVLHWSLRAHRISRTNLCKPVSYGRSDVWSNALLMRPGPLVVLHLEKRVAQFTTVFDHPAMRPPRGPHDAPASDGIRNLEARIALSEVWAAFARLTCGQQQTLLLVCVEGYSYADAAKCLGIPIGTLMSRLYRARAALMAKSTTHDMPDDAPN
jgi:hypothetical protein